MTHTRWRMLRSSWDGTRNFSTLWCGSVPSTPTACCGAAPVTGIAERSAAAGGAADTISAHAHLGWSCSCSRCRLSAAHRRPLDALCCSRWCAAGTRSSSPVGRARARVRRGVRRSAARSSERSTLQDDCRDLVSRLCLTFRVAFSCHTFHLTRASTQRGFHPLVFRIYRLAFECERAVCLFLASAAHLCSHTKTSLTREKRASCCCLSCDHFSCVRLACHARVRDAIIYAAGDRVHHPSGRSSAEAVGVARCARTNGHPSPCKRSGTRDAARTVCVAGADPPPMPARRTRTRWHDRRSPRPRASSIRSRECASSVTAVGVTRRARADGDPSPCAHSGT